MPKAVVRMKLAVVADYDGTWEDATQAAIVKVIASLKNAPFEVTTPSHQYVEDKAREEGWKEMGTGDFWTILIN